MLSGHSPSFVAGLLAAMAMLPVVLVGAVVPYLPPSLGIGPREVGLVSSAFFLVGGCGTWFAGRVVDRASWQRSLRIACTVSAGCLLAIGGTVQSGAALALWTVIAATAFAIAFPTSSVILARSPHNTAFAYGLKDAALPASTLVAGLVVPPLAVRGLWSLAYLVCAALPLVLLVVAGRVGANAGDPPEQAVQRDSHGRGSVDLRWLVVVMGVASLIPGSLVAFTVSSAVASGLGAAAAGRVLAISSLLGMVARVGVGRVVDRMGWEPLRAAGWLLVLGSASVLLLAAPSEAMAVLGSIAAFVFGWGWPGVLFFGVVHWFPQAPGGATGRVQTGGSIGTAIGPLLIGIVAERAGYQTAWALVGAAGGLAAVVLLSVVPRPPVPSPEESR